MNVSMNEGMSEFMDGCTGDKWLDGINEGYAWRNKFMDGYITDKWLDGNKPLGKLNEWMDVQMNE